MPRRSVTALASAFVLFILLALHLRSSGGLDGFRAQQRQQRLEEAANLHILIPATSSNAELCKCILTSYILGYPTPTLVNWHLDSASARPDLIFGGSHIAKITGILRYLTQEHISSDDLVLVIDGFDTWFQLPPTVLMERYHRINKQAMARLEEDVGLRAMNAEDIYQSIVFPAEKIGPMPIWWQTPATYAVPESPLRDDLYGNDTDPGYWGGDGWVYSFARHDIRPKWLNSGLAMGPIADVRRLFQAVQQLVNVVEHGGSDQVLFSRIFGEQSYQREVMRLQHRTMFDRIQDWLGNVTGTRQPSMVERDPLFPAREHMLWFKGHPAEYRVGLDYGLEMSFSMTGSEGDGVYLVHNTTESLHQQQVIAEVGAEPLRVSAPLASDIRDSLPPFIPLRGAIDPSNPDLNKTWSEVKLFTNYWTETVPVTMHMNGLKSMRQTLWADLWYHKHLRDFVRVRSGLGGDRGPGATDETGKFLDWRTLCAGTDEEVFRDVVVDLDFDEHVDEEGEEGDEYVEEVVVEAG